MGIPANAPPSHLPAPLRQAMEHLEAIYGSEKHWLYVATMHNLALMYEAAGRYKQAHDSMQHVVKLRLQVGMVHTCVDGWLVSSTRL